MLAAGQNQPAVSNISKGGGFTYTAGPPVQNNFSWQPAGSHQGGYNKTFNPTDDKSASSTASSKHRPNVHTSNLASLQQTHASTNFQYPSNFVAGGVAPLNVTKNTNPDVPKTPTPISVGIPPETVASGPTSSANQTNPPIGSILMTAGDRTPVHVTRVDEYKSASTNLSGLTNLPKVPSVAQTGGQNAAVATTKQDIEKLNTQTAKLIEQYKVASSTPRPSYPVQQPAASAESGAQLRYAQQPQVPPAPQAPPPMVYTQAQLDYMKQHSIPMMPLPIKPLDYSDPTAMYTPEQDAKIRADFRVKFSILREHSPNMIIPEPPETMPIYLINAAYLEYIKKIHVESSVEQNKSYLLIIWLLIEVFGCKMCNLPCAGFTSSQFKYVNKYEMLLIELGEKSYNASAGSSWPIEVRIFFMAAMNAVIFVLVKMLSDYIGTDQMGEQLRDSISEWLMNNKGANVIKRAQEATADNIPAPQPDAAPPLGNLGGIIAQLAQGMMGGGGAGQPAGPPPTKQRPTPYGNRAKRD